MATSTLDKDIICSGALFYARDTKRFLFLQRTKSKQAGQWGLVGGTAEKGETPWSSLQREIKEEVGETGKIQKVIPLEMFTSTDEKFFFHTFIAIIEKEFMPTLNGEHSSYAWCAFKSFPKPLHVGLRNTLLNKTNQIKLKTIVDIIDNI